jgi:hypothetical protein
MDRDRRHRGIERLIIDRQVLSKSPDRRRKTQWTLGTHHGGRFDRQDVPIERLVRTRAGADVQNGSGVS